MLQRHLVLFSLPTLVCSLLMADSVAASPDPSGEYRTVGLPIAGGTTDNERTAVVGLSRGGTSICSGSLIAPNLVLTAQHCVADTPYEYAICGDSGFDNAADPRILFVTTDTSVFGGDFYIGEELHVPPGGNDICGYDMALIILEENIPPEEALYIIPRIDLSLEVGEEYTAVGYGHTGNGQGAGVRRALPGLEVECVGSDCNFWSFVQETEWQGGAGVCQGDSGGPALDQDGQVIGVVSRGPEGCGATVYGSVYAWGDWIIEIGERAAELGGYEPPPWVTFGDSDPALLDLDSDGLRNELDNCPQVANPEQTDEDTNGVGDDCQIFPEPRGGSCAVCDGCVDDGDCFTGFCLQNGGELGICTEDCDPNAEVSTCRGNTTCQTITDIIGNQQSLCLNYDLPEAGICQAEFVCDVSATIPAPEPEPGTGTNDGGEGKSGCTTTTAPSTGFAASLLLAMLVFRRRRNG
jgi:MYXO-CTERM domain-containing protein